MAPRAVPGAGSGRAWAGSDGKGQCIRPGCRAGPGVKGTGKGRAPRTVAGLGAPFGDREEREKAQGTLWGGPPARCVVEPGRYHRAE